MLFSRQEKKKNKKFEKNIRNCFYQLRNKIFPVHNPDAIIIAGWPASGSTPLFQIAQNLGLNPYKKHGKRKKTINFTLFTIRDPRDIICSQAKRKFSSIWEEHGSENALLKAAELFTSRKYKEAYYESLKMPNVFMIRYERYFPEKQHLLLDFIADNFNIKLSTKKREDILKSTSIKRNVNIAQKYHTFKNFDEVTHIHGNHISNKGKSGAWKKDFTPKVKEKVKKEIGNLIIDLGYSENFDF